MNHLPNWLKWLIVLATLLGCIFLMYYTNLRNATVDMPDPDWFTTLTAISPATDSALPLLD